MVFSKGKGEADYITGYLKTERLPENGFSGSLLLCIVELQQCVYKLAGVERAQVVDAFANADVTNRQPDPPDLGESVTRDGALSAPGTPYRARRSTPDSSGTHTVSAGTNWCPATILSSSSAVTQRN